MSSNTAQFNGPGQTTEGWQLYRMPGLVQVWTGPGPVPSGIMEPGVTYRMVHVTNLGSAEVEFTTPAAGAAHVYDSLGG